MGVEAMLRYHYTDNNEFGRRLREARKASGMTLQTVAEKLNSDFSTNINKGTISKYENGVHEPSASTIHCLGQILGVSGEYLLGKTNLHLLESTRQNQNTRHSGVLSGEPQELPGHLSYQITDDSMYPRYLIDDILIVQPASTCENGQFCLIRLDNGQTLIRRVLIRQDSYIFQPVNTIYEPLFFAMPERKGNEAEIVNPKFSILGIVVEMRRKES
jgi:SOS-response transcriptional repressor LexA